MRISGAAQEASSVDDVSFEIGPAETLALADLYAQRRFPARAWTLVDEVLELDPENQEALAFAQGLGPKEASHA